MKTIYYRDELNDDFAPSNGKIKVKKIGDKYKYVHKSPLWKFFEILIYRLIATPIGFLICFFGFGTRIKNKKVLRKMKGSYFIYGNHTNSLHDSFAPTLFSFPKRVRIITSPDAVSIKGIGSLVNMMGAIPLPSDMKASVNFLEALNYAVKKRNAIMIYPEAHIWPYYNKIRPFKDASFIYPVKMSLPAIPVTTVYKQRKIFKKMYPRIVLYIGEAVYPNKDLPVNLAREDMRDRVYNEMVKTVKEKESFEYIRYEKEKES
ncbi:MAG: 1-acyl-sn-glycerol-3-phosphate acyltransferase [Bacillales bacterium]|nr:1-acyl-sn-glycerol-3-phosphate acyltransferase [Bacillales bacterium]